MALTVAAALVALSLGPAQAEDSSSGGSQGLFSRIVSVPRAAAGVFVGVAVGVPVRTGRYIVSESHRMVETLHDDFGGEPTFNQMLMARSLGIPYGIASGSMLGLIRGVEYGVEYGAKEPFSKESMGFEDPSQ